MNKQRYKELGKIIDRANDLRQLVDTIKEDLEELRDLEEEAMDNMPENLQETERYYEMGEWVEKLEELMDEAGNASDSLEYIVYNCDI